MLISFVQQLRKGPHGNLVAKSAMKTNYSTVDFDSSECAFKTRVNNILFGDECTAEKCCQSFRGDCPNDFPNRGQFCGTGESVQRESCTTSGVTGACSEEECCCDDDFDKTLCGNNNDRTCCASPNKHCTEFDLKKCWSGIRHEDALCFSSKRNLNSL